MPPSALAGGFGIGSECADGVHLTSGEKTLCGQTFFFDFDTALLDGQMDRRTLTPPPADVEIKTGEKVGQAPWWVPEPEWDHGSPLP